MKSLSPNAVIAKVLRVDDPNSVVYFTVKDLVGDELNWDEDILRMHIMLLAKRMASDTRSLVEVSVNNELWVITIAEDKRQEVPFISSHTNIFISGEKGSLGMELDRGDSKPVKSSSSLLEGLELSRVMEKRNSEAFERMLPQLLQTDLGKFVAIFEGKIVGTDIGKASLVTKLPRNLIPAAHLMVRQVIEKQEPTVVSTNRPLAGTKD